jgi:G3E family GTPase
MGVPVTVLGGYLGAGKTTIVNALLADSHGLRIAVVVNDFGSVNIDATLIAARAARRIDLTNGCACCQVGDTLGDACFELAEADPPFDRIVIEASGVADPRQVASWASLPGLELDGVVVVADPATVQHQLGDPLIGGIVHRQLAGADLIVLSRTDVAGRDVVERAAQAIRELDLGAPTIHSRIDGVPLAALIDLDAASRSVHHPAAAGHEHVTGLWRPTGPVDVHRLRSALTAIPGLVRAKGFVASAGGGNVVVHLVGSRVAITPWPHDAEPAIVGIGHQAVFDALAFAPGLDAALADGAAPNTSQPFAR